MELDRRRVLAGMGLTALGALGPAAVGDAATREYDYIVIGSGPGGAPVAANLAEAGHSVLVLEAGPPTGDAVLRDVPLFFPRATEDKEVSWDFYVQHFDGGAQAHGRNWVDGKGILYPRASTLGGCASHNANILMYPAHSDWDAIMELTGDEGWHHETMWQHWLKVLEWQAVSYINPYAGLKSPRTDPGTLVKSLDGPDWFLKSLLGWESSGRLNDKDNAGTEGFWTIPNSIKNGVRQGVRDRLISAARRHPDKLEIQCNALVEKIVLEPGAKGQRAVGVQFLTGRHLYEASPKYRTTTEAERASMRTVVRARREVIVAGGVYNSPQLLMLSGIGPREQLRRFGIEVKVDSPFVGTNLQDRREMMVVDKYGIAELAENLHVGEVIKALCGTGKSGDLCLATWQIAPSLSPLGQVGLPCVNYRTEGFAGPATNCCTLGLPAQFTGFYPGWADKAYTTVGQAWTWLTLMGYTDDRDGYVRLRSADPTRSPEINFRSFGNGKGGGKDLDALVQSVELSRRMNQTERAQREIFPGPGVTDLRDFIRKEHYGHHAACTNPIGRSVADSVLDSRFRVHGTEGLRVVDASAFPRMPGLFIVAALETLSQKASKDILRDARV